MRTVRGDPGSRGEWSAKGNCGLELVRPILRPVLYFFRRGVDSMSCETRLNPDGPGFQLVITETRGGRVDDRIENFGELRHLLAREHELLQAWRAQGWRDIGAPTPTPPDKWPGPR